MSQLRVKAKVDVSLTIELLQPWDPAATMETVHRQAADNARRVLVQVFNSGEAIVCGARFLTQIHGVKTVTTEVDE